MRVNRHGLAVLDVPRPARVSAPTAAPEPSVALVLNGCASPGCKLAGRYAVGGASWCVDCISAAVVRDSRAG